MRYEAAGDCLLYGMGKEFMLEDEDVDFFHFKAFIVHFYLLGCLTRESVKALKRIINGSEYEKEENLKGIATILIRELSRIFKFSDSETMFEMLNSIKIPKYVFDKVDFWFELMPDIAYQEPYMIFITSVNERYYHLRRINVYDSDDNDCEYALPYFYGYSDNYSIEELSNVYSNIVGTNAKNGTVYLSPAYTNCFFTEYSPGGETETIYHGELLGLIDSHPVVEDDDYIYIFDDEGNRRNLITRNPIENYKILNNKIYVEARRNGPGFIIPYYVDSSGNRTDLTYKEKADYIFKKIKYDNSLKDADSDINVFLSTINFQHQKLTLGFLKEFFSYFDDSDEYIEDANTLIALLNQHIDDDVDIVDYLYLFRDVSQRLDFKPSPRIISHSLVCLVTVLEKEDDFSEMLNDFYKFKAGLLKFAFWTDERIAIEEKKSYCLIGGFQFERGGEFIADKKRVSDGVILGNTIISDDNHLAGQVSYDLTNGMYVIKYTRELEPLEFLDVIEKFNLPKDKFRIIIDDKSAIT